MAAALDDIQLLKLGVKFRPPALVLTYRDSDVSRRRRTIPVKSITKDSVTDELLSELYETRRHEK